MALTHSTTARNAMADAVVDLLDGGTLVLQTSGDGEVATLTFGTPAFGAAANGTASSNAITQDSSATGGTVAKFKLVTSGAADLVFGNVQTSGGDLNMSTLVINPGDIITCTGGITYSACA